jgi:hypothetical protein
VKKLWAALTEKSLRANQIAAFKGANKGAKPPSRNNGGVGGLLFN